MSSTTATRTPRLTPPAAPTRKPTPRRRTLGQGASPVGRADRPMLRIVAGRPSVEPAETLLPSVVEPASAASGVETQLRQVDLDDFFASEWDGDDVSVEVVRPRPSSLRLTRRGRLAVFVASLAALLGLGLVAATGSLADDQPEPTRVVTVQPGQTLWRLRRRRAGHDGPPRDDQPPRLLDAPGRPAPPRAPLIECVEITRLPPADSTPAGAENRGRREAA